MEEEIIEPVIEKETFKRHEDSNFIYTNVNVKHIQVIGERLFYSNSTNPGFIDKGGAVNQLCCMSQNNYDMKQSFSENYIVSASAHLKGFSVYKTDNNGTGFLSFEVLDIHQNKNTTIPFTGWGRKCTLNGDHLLASVYEDNNYGNYIYDIASHTNFVGLYKREGVIKVDFSAYINPNIPYFASGKKCKYF